MKNIELVTQIAYSSINREEMVEFNQINLSPYIFRDMITDVIICPEEIVMPWNKGMMIVAYNHCEVYLKTIHFKQLIGKS